MWDIFKRKEKLLKEFNSKNSKMWHEWREIYAPPLLETLKNKIDASYIEKMYLLLNFHAKDKYLNDCLKNIAQKNYRKLSKMSGLVPFADYDTDYPMYDIVYITDNEKNYFAIVDNSHEGTKKDLTLKHIIETEPIDLTRFLERRLIYPV